MSYPCLCQLRPGGPELTAKLLANCSLTKDSRVLDIGCGRGETVRLIRDAYTPHVLGVDTDPRLLAAARTAYPELEFCSGQAEALEWGDASFDLVLAECSLSLADTPAALREIVRVLKPGGRLALSDVYARGEGADLGEPGLLLRQLPTWGQWLALLDRAGLAFHSWQDESGALSQMLGQLIMEQGREAAYGLLGLDSCALARIRPGYLLLWGDKP